MGKSSKVKMPKRSETAGMATFSGKKKTFDDDSDLDLEEVAEEEEDEEEQGRSSGKRKSREGSQDDDDDAPEEGGMDEKEMQRLRDMFEQHAPKEGTKKKKKKRKAKPVEEVDPKDMLDASVLEGVDVDEVDAHRGIIEGEGGEDNQEDDNEAAGNKKGERGLKIDRNKRGSKIIGDLHIKVLGKESPVKMMIKSGRGGGKMDDLLGSNERESYSVFAAQKKRQATRMFAR